MTLAVNNARGSCNSANSGSPGFFLNGSFASAGLSEFTSQLAIPLPIPIPTPPIPDSFSASFRRFEAKLPYFDAGFPPISGGCIVSVYRVDPDNLPDLADFILKDKPLNAGTLPMSGPFTGSPATLTAKEPGEYLLDLPSPGLAPGAWSLQAFTSTLNIPGPLFTVTGFGLTAGEFRRSQPLRVTWTCPDRNGQVGVTVTSVDAEKFLFGVVSCCYACRDLQAAIGTDLLGQLPLSSQMGAGISAVFMPDLAGSGKIQATGIDFGESVYSVGASVSGATLKP